MTIVSTLIPANQELIVIGLNYKPVEVLVADVVFEEWAVAADQVNIGGG